MSRVSQTLWDTFMSPMKMPPNCTFAQFEVARQMKWADEEKADAAIMLKQFVRARKQAENSARREVLDELIRGEVERLRAL